VLLLSNLVFAAGLALLAAAHGPVLLTVAWLVLGAAMALGLYDSAFAALAGLYGREARSAITSIAGFASTVGWRGACLAWAGLHLIAGLPLNRFLVPPAPPPPTANAAALTLFGPAGYGLRTGVLSVPVRVAQAGGRCCSGCCWTGWAWACCWHPRGWASLRQRHSWHRDSPAVPRGRLLRSVTHHLPLRAGWLEADPHIAGA